MLRLNRIAGVFLAIIVALLCIVPAQAADTIKLAVVEPLSGNFKDIGERYAAGVAYGVQKINEQGGLVGK